MKETSPFTRVAQKRISKQREQIKKIKDLCGRISEYRKSEESKYESMYLSADDIDIIARALVCHMSVISLDVQRQEKAIECGSECRDLGVDEEE